MSLMTPLHLAPVRQVVTRNTTTARRRDLIIYKRSTPVETAFLRTRTRRRRIYCDPAALRIRLLQQQRVRGVQPVVYG